MCLPCRELKVNEASLVDERRPPPPPTLPCQQHDDQNLLLGVRILNLPYLAIPGRDLWKSLGPGDTHLSKK